MTSSIHFVKQHIIIVGEHPESGFLGQSRSEKNMDYVSSMFQLDHSGTISTDELFDFSSFPSQQQQQTIPQDHAFLLTPSQQNGSSTDNLTNLIEFSKKRRRKSSTANFGALKDETPSNSKKKKIIHRDIERQRRQEMATLYGSLRSILPPEYLKGKRSISDLVNEAVNYIKHLEGKIQESRDKRDELKILSMDSLESCERSILTVKPCCVGVEIVLDTAFRYGIPLSRLIRVLIEDEFGIVSCISTKANERMLHTIKSEVSDGRSINVSELQQKLTDSIRRPKH